MGQYYAWLHIFIPILILSFFVFLYVYFKLLYILEKLP